MKITGNMINYYFVCQRKLWLFSHGLQYEEENENVQLGKLLDTSSYKGKRKQIMLDGTINIDFLEDWKVLHEVKKTRAIEPAAIWQLRYYLYYLQKRGVSVEKGYIDYPKLRERIEVTLDEKEINELERIIESIKMIVTQNDSPKVEKKKICPKCAYYDYCFI
ncbi:CRISPR-associated protein Cas4 [Enterococcus hermanniensis]|uniref:CRISPR-associated exonuclease Cas4 n=1 Tax=Enterococcus hermanniensis TaxID=249189 RepID=A0A1L8TGR1_9ENTE|nr:CRISPR-associated protein Cas4 [Enterococcus hermanniensis]OJG43304.1 CRISPR-associated protein cas4 [Enterococcus hermanniensis]